MKRLMRWTNKETLFQNFSSRKETNTAKISHIFGNPPLRLTRRVWFYFSRAFDVYKSVKGVYVEIPKDEIPKTKSRMHEIPNVEIPNDQNPENQITSLKDGKGSWDLGFFTTGKNYMLGDSFW
ncbi:hypothetical protein M514_10990 [Trichuris suis]|uniref:Uncharacterized protein n=1 Tax=Trichuris suis TaxID=68888 RepID=A0A085MVM1_9BILA|nr:hypothetical protein M514_10990 [Trichuris suis]